MKKINKNELYTIIGGATLTGTMLSAITKGVSTIYNIGRALGSALRRAISGKYCSL